MQRISEIVGITLRKMREHARPGISTRELDEYGAGILQHYGARSAPGISYGFPGATCISVNHEAAHGMLEAAGEARHRGLGAAPLLELRVDRNGRHPPGWAGIRRQERDGIRQRAVAEGRGAGERDEGDCASALEPTPRRRHGRQSSR